MAASRAARLCRRPTTAPPSRNHRPPSAAEQGRRRRRELQRCPSAGGGVGFGVAARGAAHNAMPAPMGVPHVACAAAASIYGLAAILSMVSIALPWFEGAAGGDIVNENAEDKPLESSVSLWDYQLKVQQAPEPGETQTTTKSFDTSWDDQCSKMEDLNKDEAKHWPSTCTKVRVMRAMGFLSIIIGLAAAAVLVIAMTQMILLALIGAILGTVCTLCVLAQCVFAALIATAGLAIGAQIAAGALVISMMGVMISLYGAAKAVKQENVDPEEEVEGTRQERATQARKAAAETRLALENNLQKSERAPQKIDEAGRRDSVTPEQRAPVYLQKVLFWGQEEGEDEGEIPQELLEFAFKEIDDDDSGVIEMEELVEALRLCGLEASQAASDTIMKEIDKNASGDVDIHEFVEFFRNIEELSAFHKKSQRRAQFATFLLNCCFLVDIVVVGVLLMIFIRLDETTSNDDYVILKQTLTIAGLLLAVLFVCVVGLPAARLTLGPPMSAYKKYYATLAKRKKKPPPAPQEAGRPKDAFHVEVAPIQGELMAQSYRRVDQVQNMIEYSRQLELEASSQTGRRTRRTTRMSSKTSAGSSQLALPAPPAAPSGAVVDRYHADAYRKAHKDMLEARTQQSFSALQVRTELDTERMHEQNAAARSEAALWGGSSDGFGGSRQLALGYQ